MTIHIALLRGINVGGNNKIKMADLREALNRIGLARVQTYIQSGNILFESDEDETVLRQQIERVITDEFGLSIRTIIRTSEEMNAIASSCPFTEEQIAKAGTESTGEVLYVSMLLEEPPADRVEKLKPYQTEGEMFHLTGNNMYLLFNPSIRNSKLAIQADKLGVPTTVRNWKTINKLAALANEMAEDKKA